MIKGDRNLKFERKGVEFWATLEQTDALLKSEGMIIQTGQSTGWGGSEHGSGNDTALPEVW